MPIRDKVYNKLKSLGLTDSKEDFFNYYDNDENVRKDVYRRLREDGLRNSEDEFYSAMKPQKVTQQPEDNAAFEANAERFRNGQPIDRVTTQSVIDANPELGLQQPVVDQTQQYIMNNKPAIFGEKKKSLMDIPLNVSPDVVEGSQNLEKLSERARIAEHNIKDPFVQKARTEADLRGLSSEIDGLLEKSVQEGRASVGGSAFMPAGARGRAYTEANKDRVKEVTDLSSAKRLLDQSQYIIDAAKRGDTGILKDTWQGFKDSLEAEDFTFGLADAAGSASILDAIKKVENGEELTEAEDKLLRASAINMATQYYYANDLNRAYKAGQVSAESVPFMLEMAINPISSLGKASAKTLLNYGLKSYAKQVGKGLAKGAAAGTGMALTTGLGRVAAGTTDRLAEGYNYGVDFDGNLYAEKKEDAMGVGEAVARSLASTAIENQSEMIFNAFKGFGGFMKGVQDVLPGGVNKFFEMLGNNKAADAYRAIKNSPVFRNYLVKDIRNATQIGGLGEEYLEEVYNNIANAAIGEMKWEDVVSLDKNIDTLLGLAPTQVMFGLLGLGGAGAMRYQTRKTLEDLQATMNEQQRKDLEGLLDMGLDAKEVDVRGFIRNVMQNESYTIENKRDLIKAAYNVAKQNGIDELTEADTIDKVNAENAEIDAATDPQTGMYGEVSLVSKDLDDNDVVSNANVFGEKEVNGELYLLVLPEGESEKKWVRPNEYDVNSYEKRPAEQVKALNEEMIREEEAVKAENEARWHPNVPKPHEGVSFFNGEEEVTIVGIDANTGGLFVAPSEEYRSAQGNEKKMAELVNGAFQLGAIPVEQYKDAMTQQIEAEEQEAAPEIVEEVQPTEEADVKENLTTESSDNLSPVEEVAQPQAEVQTPVIPTKEDGSIDFVSYGKEGTFKTLGEKYGEKMPNKVAVTAKALAEDLKKAQNKLQKAEEAYDNAPIGREQKAEEARDKAKQELEAIQREANFWAEMDAEIKDAQARRESMLNPQSEVETSTEPMNVDEFVAQQLASGNIVLDKEDYKKETGYGDVEANAMNGGATKLFGKNGMTIQEAGERLMEIDRENGTNFFDQLDSNSGRDALINVLGSVKSRKELNQYIATNRAEQAKRESEGLRNELEKQAMEANYASLEDYVLQMEAAEMENPFLNDRADEIMAIFAEEAAKYEQSLNNTENGQGTENEVVEGNDSILPEEQLDNTGGTEVSEESERIGDGTSEESESTHAATEVELKQEEGETTLQFAERAAEENRRRPLRKRAEEWSKALGVKVHFIEKLDDVDNQTAYIALSKGSKVAGWYEGTTGKVFFYMPNLDDISEVDKTYIHEVVAHKGLREMLGRERFNELCDKVWDMMPDTEKAKFIGYPGVNGNTRAAADEYIAYLSEKENLTPEEKTMWDRVVKALRDIFEAALNSIIGKTKLTDEDISNLIKASYANLKSGIQISDFGDRVEVEGVRFNIKTNKEVVENREKQLKRSVRNGILSKKEADEIREASEAMLEIAEVIAQAEKEDGTAMFPSFSQWNGMEVRLNANGMPAVSVLKSNGDYAMNIDFAKDCIKRDATNRVLNRLAQVAPEVLTSMSAEQLTEINNIIKRHGLSVPCVGCFVEARRYRSADFARSVVNVWNALVDAVGKGGKAIDAAKKEFGNKVSVDNIITHLQDNPSDMVLLSESDIVSPDKYAALMIEHPQVPQLLQGTQGQNNPHLVVPEAIYYGDVLKLEGEKAWDVDAAYAVGGVRIQSFSDFKAKLFFDYCQVLADLASKKLPAHSYTKVPSFAELFGLAGVKINLSLYFEGTGLGSNGEYQYSSESISPEFAYEIQTRDGYTENVGTMAIGVSDAHIWKMMKDPNIRSISPYHKSGINAAVAKKIDASRFVDYSNEQNAVIAKAEKMENETFAEYYARIAERKDGTVPKYGLKTVPKFNLYDDLLNTEDPVQTAMNYVEHCQQNGIVPKFPSFVYNQDGSFNNEYYKLIYDFAVTDKDGIYAPQGAVKWNEDAMPANTAEILTSALEVEEATIARNEEEVDSVVSDILNEVVGEGTRFRVKFTEEEQSIIDKAKEDGTYMKAPNGESTNLTEKRWAQVRTKAFKTWFGDWEKNPKKSSLMIDENGEPKVFYHGSPSRFNEFISDKMGETGTGYGQGFYFSPEKWFAEGYVGENGGTIYEVFLNLRKPISDTKKTLKKPSIKRFIDEIDKRMMERDDDGIGILDNWNDVSYYGRNKVLNEATEAVFEYNETDLEIVGDLINTSGSYDIVTEVLRDVLGFDGILPSNTDNEVIVHHPNQIKSATDNVGTFNSSNNDIRFRFIGERGARNLDKAEEATTRLDNLAVAREMEGAEKDAKTIKMATGWERGADGLWRYETMDSETAIKDGDEVEIRKQIEDIEEEEKAYKKKAREEGIGPDEREEAYINFYRRRGFLEAQLAYVMAKNADVLTHISTSLYHVLDKTDSDSLFKAYPELEFVKVGFATELVGKSLGATVINGSRIEAINLDVKRSTPEELNGYLAHEIQHAIQEIEGFAPGGDPSMESPRKAEQKAKNISFMKDKLDKSVSERNSLLKQRNEINDKMSAWWNAHEDATREDMLADKDMQQFNREYDELSKQIDEADKTVKFNERWLDATLQANTALGYEGYKKLAGEVEARNVTSRLGMTLEQRINSLASETEDVAREDQIFLKDGIESGMRFRLSEKGKQIQTEVDKFTSKYNSKPVRIVEAEMDDNELMKTLDYAFELEDVKSFMKESKTAAGYFHNLDKIIIFADKTKVERMEEYLFHENIHAAIHHNNFANLVAHFYEYAKNEAVFEKWSKLAHNKEYKQYNSSEEFLAYVVSNAMVARNLDEVAEYLGEKQKKALNKLFNVIGYDYDIRRRSDEQSVNGRTSEETSGESSLEGNELLNTGEGRGTGNGTGKGKSGKVSAAERKARLNELFNKVADMGLQGVLGNKEYTSLMVDIYKALPEGVRAEIAEDALRLYGGSVAPAVSDYIGPKSKNSIMDKVVTIVREALRKIGFDLDLNANEVRYMAWRSKKPLDRNNMFEVAEDIDMKYRLKVGEYDGTTPDGGGTRFSVKSKPKTKAELKEEVRDLKEDVRGLKEEVRDLKKQVNTLRSGNKDEWEKKQRAIVSFIKGRLTKEAGSVLGKTRLDQLLVLVNKASTATDLRKPLQFIEQVINDASIEHAAAKMDKLIKTKLQGETNRGVAKGVVVDESTRRLFDSIRGTFKELIATSIDSELRSVRGEILRFGKEINDLPKDDVQGRTILRARQEAMKERRKELEAEQEELQRQNINETKESLERRHDELVEAMDAHIEGKGIWTQEMRDEYDSIPLRLKLAEIRESQAQLDAIMSDSIMTRRNAYQNTGETRKKLLAEADVLESNYTIAQEELIRLMNEVSSELSAIINEGKSRLATRREALEERRRAIVTMGISAVKDKEIKDPNAVLTKKEKFDKWFDNSWLKSVSDFMTAPLNSFNFMLKYIDRNHTIGEGELYNHFMKSEEGALEANNRLYDGLKAYNTAIEEKAKEIFGKDIEAVMKESGKEYIGEVHKQYMYDSRSHKEGDMFPISISKGQALYVWLTWRQDDGRAKLVADGWNDQSIEEIEALIGEDYIKFGEWITDEFFPMLREEKYNKTHIDMFGTSMAKREHYFPFKVQSEDIQEKGEMGESYSGMPSTITGNIIKRTINKSRIKTDQNAFDLLYKYGNDMETWNAMAKLRQDLNFLHSSKAFRNYLEANSKGLFDKFIKSAEVAVKAYNNSGESNAINDFLVKMNRMWAGSNIGFRLNTAMKQILSYPAFMAYSSNPKYLANLAKYSMNWNGNLLWARENLPAFRQRVETGDLGMKGMSDPQFDLGKYLKMYSDISMIPNQFVDALTCAAGARSVYDFEYNRAIKAGLSEEEARNIAQYNAEVAFNETQQSSREEFVSPIQMSRNVLIKSMMNYQNSNVGYQRLGNEGLLEIMRAKHVYEQDIKDGMSEEEAKKKVANSILRGTRKMMIAFTILPGLWYLGGRGIVGITSPIISSLFGGGDDDEPYLDDEAKEGLMLSMALGPVAGTTGGQLISNVVQGMNYNPMAWFEEFQKDISKSMKEGFNLNVIKNTALKLAQYVGGINVETWENIYLAEEHAIRTGNFDLVDFMFLINLPPSQRKKMAEELYSDMPFMEYAEKVSRAQKLFDDYRKNLPYAKGDKNGSKKNAIKKQYVIENLSDDKQDKLEKEKEFKKLQREYNSEEDKAEWLEDHPEYTELEKNFKDQEVTKEVNQKAKELK